MRIGLGLDTGGTFTDAVLMDLETGKLLSKSKSPTTHEDLCIGIRKAIELLPSELLSSSGVVSLSSTLATNSIVEGKGARVALICIGEDYDGSYPAEHSVRIEGSHDLDGDETVQLDEDAAMRFLESIRGKVDGVAITGFLSVRNPEHEVRIRDLVRSTLGIPTVCSHELSSGLGFSERAATCVMNARLLPVIDDLILSVKAVLKENSVNAPLMVVRGDGTMMGEKEARIKPIQTVMSGPAASLIGALRLTGRRDAIVMDMGGTTTDIGIIRDGRPRLDEEGAIVSGIRTKVSAAKMSTTGIGGDSRITVEGGEILLSPLRVVPLCRAAEMWQSVRNGLDRLSAVDADRDIRLDCEFFRTLKIPSDHSGLTETDLKLLNILSGEPVPLREAGEAIGVHPLMLDIGRLESRGLIQRIGFTPTDVLHASGALTTHDPMPSAIAAAFLASKMHLEADRFLESCMDAIRLKLCRALITEVMSDEAGYVKLGPGGEALLRKAVSGSIDGGYGCRISIDIPIIGIGAPACAYVPLVAGTFDAEAVIDSDSDVGNAIGAISSSVSETVSVLIRPIGSGTDISFREFSGNGTFDFDDLDEAIAHARMLAETKAVEAVESGGATDIVVSCERKDKEFRYGGTMDKGMLGVELTVTAAGRPDPFGP